MNTRKKSPFSSLIKLFEFIGYSNIYVSLGAASLGLFTTDCLKLNFGKEIAVFLFFSTLFAYNMQRLLWNAAINTKKIEAKPSWLDKNQGFIKALILLSFCGSFYAYSNLPQQILWVILPLGFISLLYVLQIKPIPSLRSVPYIKVFIVGFVWGGACTIIPIITNLHWSAIWQWEIQVFALAIAAFVFGESLPFDIRDIRQDMRSKLLTIPHKLGVRRTLSFSYLALIISTILFGILYLFNQIGLLHFLAFLTAVIFTFIAVSQLNFKRHPLYFAIILESSLLLPLLFLWLFKAVILWL